MDKYKRTPWVLRRYVPDDETPSSSGTVIIRIAGEQGEVDERTTLFVQCAVAAFLRISPNDVRIGPLEEGSVKVTVELPREDAERLLREYASFQLSLQDYLAPYELLDVQRGILDRERRPRAFPMPLTLPDWWKQTRQEIEDLRDLEENWDSYGAYPIHTESINRALAAMEHLAELEGVTQPKVAATPAGQVGLSWDAGDWSLDATICEDGAIQYVYIHESDHSRDFENSTRNVDELVAFLTN